MSINAECLVVLLAEGDGVGGPAWKGWLAGLAANGLGVCMTAAGLPSCRRMAVRRFRIQIDGQGRPRLPKQRRATLSRMVVG